LDMKDVRDVRLLQRIADDMFALVHELGGTISGEHGDGRIRSCYIPLQYSSIYEIFLQVKRLLDPSSMFNPDIITHNDPAQMMKDLRFGEDYSSQEPTDKLLIWGEGMAGEIEKCHGCSKCTTVTAATRMCPMYKATRDELSAPKAKANILRALISGKVDDEELYERSIQAVVDRCVNCGSCSKECPSQVNIPKLVLEAHSKYIKREGMTIENMLVTHFENFGRYTRKLFPIISPLMKLKPLRKVAELFAGMSAERQFIKFSSRSLYDRFATSVGNGKKILYFAGCYASYMRPEIGESTIRVLNHLGYQVLLPDQHCCGVPHMAKGGAEEARAKIQDNLAEWGHLIDSVDYIVASCSSCAFALQKEWAYYMGGELVEKVKSKVVHVTQLIAEHLGELELTADGVSVAYHTPCHMRMLKDNTSSWRVLSGVSGMKAVALRSGCCGMAGSWGISAKHYDESVKIGTPMIMSLLDSGASICATDCPTCEMQLRHLSDKTIYNPVELVDKMLTK
jgi:Fe-S oxidoreductase